MDEVTKSKLQKKIEKDGGDRDFVNTIENIIIKEGNGAENSKKEYFLIEKLIIFFSMLSSITAAVAVVDISSWGQNITSILLPCIEIMAVIFPAIVTALVAYRGLRKSFETWIRHRKYNLELELLVNEYLYGSKNFKKLKGKDAYKEFRDKIQDLFQKSKQEFFTNMSK